MQLACSRCTQFLTLSSTTPLTQVSPIATTYPVNWRRLKATTTTLGVRCTLYLIPSCMPFRLASTHPALARLAPPMSRRGNPFTQDVRKHTLVHASSTQGIYISTSRPRPKTTVDDSTALGVRSTLLPTLVGTTAPCAKARKVHVLRSPTVCRPDDWSACDARNLPLSLRPSPPHTPLKGASMATIVKLNACNARNISLSGWPRDLRFNALHTLPDRRTRHPSTVVRTTRVRTTTQSSPLSSTLTQAQAQSDFHCGRRIHTLHDGTERRLRKLTYGRVSCGGFARDYGF